MCNVWTLLIFYVNLQEQQTIKSGDGGGQHCSATSVSVNGTGSQTGITASTTSATKLSDVFPSLLTAEDRKPSPPPPEHHHLQQQLAQAQDLVRYGKFSKSGPAENRTFSLLDAVLFNTFINRKKSKKIYNVLVTSTLNSGINVGPTFIYFGFF